MVISLIATWSKRLVAFCLAFVILWHLVPHPAPRPGKAVVHVASTHDVVVWVDQNAYRIESAADTPVVCELEPGPHVARVWRHGLLEGEESFTVRPGRVAVIGPIDRESSGAGAASVRPATATAVGPTGLAARVQRSVADITN